MSSSTMILKTVKDIIISITDDKKDNPLLEEMEIMHLKQDTLIEGTKIIVYETLIEITKRINGVPTDEIISSLRQSLDEERNMHK